MEQHLIAYYVGILIVFGSHVYMLSYPDKPLTTMAQHAYLNIFGALLIAYYFMYKENFITM